MRREDLQIDVGPTNGRPQRLVIAVHLTRGHFRDNVDTNSYASRERFISRAGERLSVDPGELTWLHEGLVEAADAADRRADEAAASGGGDRERKSTADELVELALARYRIGRTDTDEPFAVERDGPNVAILFRGGRDALRATLAREYRRVFGRTANSNSLADSLTTLAGDAYAAEREPVHLRVAEYAGNIVIDLGDTTGRAVVVTPGAWRVVDRSPVLFRRTAATGALPVPQSGGHVAELREMLNVSDETWPLVLGWLVAAFVPNMPHPILILGGQQGVGKSTAARQLVGLIDPSPAVLRSQPRNEEAWAISASASWVIAVDNVSAIPDWWSDSLCKAVTGDGWFRR
jgi:hypothetical protein